MWITHARSYSAWLDSSKHGEMGYLKRGEARRHDPRLLMPEAVSVISVVVPYSAAPYGELNPEEGVQYARYLRGRDYHLEIPERLERAMKEVSATEPSLKWKVCVDTSAVLERSIAAMAGLGWIGKNSMLIHPKWGSFVFLGEILLNQEIHREPQLHPDYCGHCERCLRACPTQAFSLDRTLDSRRCISYWTLEKRGTLELDRTDQAAIGNRVAGCDICQEVCPFNQKRMTVESDGEQPLSSWEELSAESEESYRNRVKPSALSRIKPNEFKRNVLNARMSVVKNQP